MKLLVRLVGVVLACGGCTGSNSKSCLDGTCGDPARPFCDADGAISGTPGLCVSVDCTPNTFEMCRGDAAVVCNATGTNYDLMQCEHGCGATGCNPGVCTANTNSCGANGALFMCDAEGLQLMKIQDCQYGCTTDHCNACAASTKFCSGDDLVMCSSGGEITNPMSCQFGCQGMACNACMPNTTFCQSGNSVSCTAGGQPGMSQNCGAAGCQSGVCNTCTPNTTTCQGDNLVVCNGGGTIQSVTPCALGCNTTASPRCNSLVPLFGVPAPSGTLPNLTIDANATLDISNCAALDVKLTVGPTTTTLPTSQVTVVSQTGAAPICVVKFATISIADTFALTVTNNATLGHVLSLEGTGDITIAGTINFLNASPGPSAGADVATVGTNAAARHMSAGPGGGGGAFAGGTGGTCILCNGVTRAGGPGGAAVTSTNVLFGGSKGGDVIDSGGVGAIFGLGGKGGGGLHLVSLTRVTIAATGVINLNGFNGSGPRFNAGVLTAGGGGSGGKLVIEAPAINMSAGAIVVANGGGGAGGGFYTVIEGGGATVPYHYNGQSGQLSTARAAGGDIANTTDGDGGYEADGTLTPSSNGAPSDSGAATYDGGGGGGSRGFIVLRGRTAAGIMIAFGAVISPAPTMGTVMSQ